jgi:S-DNA-T family DNA segregation ATPase FtsK/SpoIIIE
METVTPETLEMTSRLIEKKLKDFGVEVRVVAASPGPVITRYEIEPATGREGRADRQPRQGPAPAR